MGKKNPNQEIWPALDQAIFVRRNPSMRELFPLMSWPDLDASLCPPFALEASIPIHRRILIKAAEPWTSSNPPHVQSHSNPPHLTSHMPDPLLPPQSTPWQNKSRLQDQPFTKQTPPPSSSADHHHHNPQKRESRTQKLQLFFNSSKTPIPKFCTQGLLRHKHTYLSTSLSQISYTSPTTHNHHLLSSQ